MTEHNLPYWIAAAHLRDMSSRTFLRCLAAFPDIKTFLTSSRADLLEHGMKEKHIHAIESINWAEVNDVLAWQQQAGHQIITLEDDVYPVLLKETYDPPLILYVKGSPAILLQPQIAMVGSRQASPIGAKNAQQFASQLAASGYVITSGLAKGVDTASHQGALRVAGKTVAVVGTGLRQIYPPTNRSLLDQILAMQGVIVSELPLNAGPLAHHFPRRNRIIAGLSLGVLVVEAAIKSGSLITARFAMEEGRDVFAIPGSIHHHKARGCHHLIRQGAKLVEAASDIVEELGALKAVVIEASQGVSQQPKTLKIPRKELLILEQIEYAVTPLDEIILRSGLTASEVSSILLSLELSGYVQSLPGGYMRTDPR